MILGIPLVIIPSSRHFLVTAAVTTSSTDAFNGNECTANALRA